MLALSLALWLLVIEVDDGVAVVQEEDISRNEACDIPKVALDTCLLILRGVAGAAADDDDGLTGKDTPWTGLVCVPNSCSTSPVSE